MAKKGGVQQLQADLQNDEDFEKFLERPGLLVLDVYSEWCGPCLGMVGGLRKIKLESGGDNLHLAICKSDTITALKRFNKKSEPTWLFVTGGKAVNIMFGTDVPKLIALLNKELEKTMQKAARTISYAVDELQPIEVEQLRVKTESTERVERIEREAKQKKQMDYLTYVTDAIIENIPDIGVTVFGPQVNRDMFKKLQEPAEPLKMQCKDRKVIQVTAEQFDIVNFACKNPLPADVIEQLDGKELLMCFWKIDEGVGTVPNVLTAYAHELTKERVAPPNEEFDEEHVIPPIIAPMKIKIEVELEEGEEWVEEISSEEEAKKAKHPKIKSIINVQEEAPAADDDNGELDGEEEGSEEDEPIPELDVRQSMANLGIDLDLDLDDLGEEEEEAVEEVIVKPRTRTRTVKMPPIWVPNNRRTHAALVYMYFRSQTTGFLPPDPKPEPPHVIMAFDAFKRREIMNVVERHKSEVPSYGFFTTDDPDDTTLLASSTDRYNNSGEQSPSDKIVLKVSKVQSNMMLSLVAYGPSYVSPNVIAGREEALKFFPEDYKQQAEAPEKEEDDKKKKKKGKKTEDIRASHDVPEPPPEKEEAAAPPPQAEAPPAEAEGEAPPGEAPAPAEGEGETAAPAAPAAEGEAAPAEGEAAAAPAEGAAPAEAAAPPEGEAPAEGAPAPAPAEEAPPPPPAAEAAPQAPTEEAAPAPAAEAPPEAAPEAAPEPAPAPEAPAEVAAAE
ncbi:actin cytoskeleton-regulatory complex protein PAN1 [Drosophila obscura]|uniref:actin cytoskeleton-regulatory complex protein PAN1 n=1 Tax=Drosophila obscura TaxID=7282 RepID=UPI001BB1F53F|nr:actin cytoskeleton-regulatory complex protein PAN1 [Drosophila obscura]